MGAEDIVRNIMMIIHDQLFDLTNDGSSPTTVTEAITWDTLLLCFTRPPEQWFEPPVRALPSAPRASTQCIKAVGRDLGLTRSSSRSAAKPTKPGPTQTS